MSEYDGVFLPDQRGLSEFDGFVVLALLMCVSTW
jgi:hypothetical protein